MEKTRIIEYKYDEEDIKIIRNKLIDIEYMIDNKNSEAEIIKDRIRELINEYFDL